MRGKKRVSDGVAQVGGFVSNWETQKGKREGGLTLLIDREGVPIGGEGRRGVGKFP